ncbi:hypothetical protein Pelo_15611 [Pelomyxa schiedti]|nr:hypothetical protein Pelo_15611 [Pelomyxa schiedti]
MVVLPGWLADDRASAPCGCSCPHVHPTGGARRDYPWARSLGLFRVAEALFPLVALACSRATAPEAAAADAYEEEDDQTHAGTYRTIATAARAPAPACVAWILNRKYRDRLVGEKIAEGWHMEGERLRAVKEASAVVLGLCLGGHVDEAAAMLGGGDYGSSSAGASGSGSGAGSLPALWDGREVVRWRNAFPRGSESDMDNMEERGNTLTEKVRVYLKSSSGAHRIMEKVCESGNLKAVRWFLECVMRVPERDSVNEGLWLLYTPMKSAMFTGNMEVFKWILEKYNLSNLPNGVGPALLAVCARGLSPGSYQWFAGKFSLDLNRERVIANLLTNRHCTSVEDIRWLEDYIIEFGVADYILNSGVTNADVAKWALKTSPLIPAEDTYNRLCQEVGDVEFLQWLTTEKSFTPTPATFSSVCSTSNKRALSFAKWLSTRVTLQPLDIRIAFIGALQYNNIEVAEWLEATFHVMDTLNLTAESADTLPGVCQEFNTDIGAAGLKWFLQHLSNPSAISDTSIHDALSALHQFYRGPSSMLVLLDAFPAYQLHTDLELYEKIVDYFMKSDLKSLQHFYRRVGSSAASLWTPEFISKHLPSSRGLVFCSKIVKWVVCKFNLQYTDIKVHDNYLLFCLLSRKKNRCAQWLLYHFDIPLTDIIQMMQKWCPQAVFGIDLAGWQVILSRYHPAIDGDMILKHFMPLITMSPHIATYTMHRYRSPTMQECREALAGRNSSALAPEVKLWLGLPL